MDSVERNIQRYTAYLANPYNPWWFEKKIVVARAEAVLSGRSLLGQIGHNAMNHSYTKAFISGTMAVAVAMGRAPMPAELMPSFNSCEMDAENYGQA